MGFAKPIEQYLFGNQIHVFMYLKDIIRGGYNMKVTYPVIFTTYKKNE